MKKSAKNPFKNPTILARADLDPLDRTPRHLSLNLLDPNAKDPSAW